VLPRVKIEISGGATVEIILNGRRVTIQKDEMTYEELVALTGHPQGTLLTITYRRAQDPPQGILVPRKRVTLKEGAVVNASDTSRA